MFWKHLRFILIGLVGVGLLVGAIACSGSSNKNSSADTSNSAGSSGNSAASGSVQSVAPAAGAPAAGAKASNSAGASAGSSGGAAQTDPKLQALLDRKIVQTTTVDVGVKDVGRAFTDIISAAEAAGGFVAASAFSNTGNTQVADVTVRVPAASYQDVLGKVRGMGGVSNEKSDANDVTQEYTDLQARLRTFQATEQRYLDLLSRAGSVNDILTLQDRLDSVRGQIEQTQGRINLLDHLTDLATITVHLRPVGAAGGGGGGVHPLGAAKQAWEYSLDTLVALSAAALVIAAYSWWLVAPIAVLEFVRRWWLRRRRRPGVQPT